jgi:mRNA-degrading endonuclease toxin of MazEF toxin-antitoxin module
MASPRLMERVLRIRRIEEDQCRRLLDLALAELAQLENALSLAKHRERAGRKLVRTSATSGEVMDRVAGLEESRSAGRRALTLASRIRAAEDRVASLRQDYLGKRTGRLQAQTLAEAEAAREAATNLWHAQQSLDDWYLNRMRSDNE